MHILNGRLALSTFLPQKIEWQILMSESESTDETAATEPVPQHIENNDIQTTLKFSNGIRNPDIVLSAIKADFGW
jgi:hypothetical protein